MGIVHAHMGREQLSTFDELRRQLLATLECFSRRREQQERVGVALFLALRLGHFRAVFSHAAKRSGQGQKAKSVGAVNSSVL